MKHLLVVLTACVWTACGEQKEQRSTEHPASEANKTSWELIKRPTDAHLRGLDAVENEVIWASGTQGTVLRSFDGRTWEVMHVPGAEQLDFRDVEALDSNTALVMSSGNGAFIYRTEDGGKNWTSVFEDRDSTVFLDGMDFSGGFGAAFGDPLNGRLDVLLSQDSGRTWQRLSEQKRPSTMEGEAGFAASGTGICVRNHQIKIATGGGPSSRVFLYDLRDTSFLAVPTPVKSGAATGIFSMAFSSEMNGIVVGGNYIDSTKMDSNCAYTMDGGLTWQKSQTPPGGYRSCVAFNSLGVALAVGRTGSDLSHDGGRTWQPLSDQGFYTACWFRDTWIAAGRNGLVGRMLRE